MRTRIRKSRKSRKKGRKSIKKGGMFLSSKPKSTPSTNTSIIGVFVKDSFRMPFVYFNNRLVLYIFSSEIYEAFEHLGFKVTGDLATSTITITDSKSIIEKDKIPLLLDLINGNPLSIYSIPHVPHVPHSDVDLPKNLSVINSIRWNKWHSTDLDHPTIYQVTLTDNLIIGFVRNLKGVREPFVYGHEQLVLYSEALIKVFQILEFEVISKSHTNSIIIKNII